MDYPDDTVASIDPFENSNMPLQDIINQSSIGKDPNLNSPGKSTGVTRNGPLIGGGKTMKDYEDQLSALKKENFDLKLRIYLHEEHNQHASSDGPTKNNTELQMECESLKKALEEKQKLLSQAGKAIELMEEQKRIAIEKQAQTQRLLEEAEQKKDAELDRESELFSFGITPQDALENMEKLQKMNELVSTLEEQLKQKTASLEEERNWNHELEKENRNYSIALDEKDLEMRDLRSNLRELEDRIIILEEQNSRKDAIAQQLKNDVVEKNKLLEQKNADYEELNTRKKSQIEKLRMSLKKKDEAITDLSNKHRALLSQAERKSAGSSSPPTLSLYESAKSPPRNYSLIQKSPSGSSDMDASVDRFRRSLFCPRSISTSPSYHDANDEDEYFKFYKQDQVPSNVLLELERVQKDKELAEDRVKSLENENNRALLSIRELTNRNQHLEEKLANIVSPKNNYRNQVNEFVTPVNVIKRETIIPKLPKRDI